MNKMPTVGGCVIWDGYPFYVIQKAIGYLSLPQCTVSSRPPDEKGTHKPGISSNLTFPIRNT